MIERDYGYYGKSGVYMEHTLPVKTTKNGSCGILRCISNKQKGNEATYYTLVCPYTRKEFGNSPDIEDVIKRWNKYADPPLNNKPASKKIKDELLKVLSHARSCGVFLDLAIVVDGSNKKERILFQGRSMAYTGDFSLLLIGDMEYIKSIKDILDIKPAIVPSETSVENLFKLDNGHYIIKAESANIDLDKILADWPCSLW